MAAGDPSSPAGGRLLRTTSRRAFLKTGGLVLAGVACGRSEEAAGQAGLPPRGIPRVALARRPDAVGPGNRIRQEAVRSGLQSAIARVTGAPSAAVAFRSLFRTTDVVGIKVNCLAGRSLSPRLELISVLIETLRSAGVPDRQILVWDRTDSDLERAGYTLNRSGSGPRCYGTNLEYETEPSSVGSVGSCYSKIVTSECTALISVPVLKDHDLAGVSGSLKNFYGAIHNPNKYHDSNCNPYVADVSSHPAIRRKLRLVVFDALIAQCHGGPAFKPAFAQPYGGLIVSRDPVAADRIAWKILEQMRKEKGLPTLAESKREPIWVATAESAGLGVGDLTRIEEVEA
ncbi:MAG: DUF362 domain-containing protein [Acidobacteria bacterium]|nr:DUF362 domain-containing protein [Acidobacteriota bacterium]